LILDPVVQNKIMTQEFKDESISELFKLLTWLNDIVDTVEEYFIELILKYCSVSLIKLF
jgi:hypothetical protein